MKNLIAGFLLSLAAVSASASPASEKPLPAQSVMSQTVTLAVDGLNCGACGDDLKAALKKASNASDIEPRMECGRIYLATPFDATVDEGALRMTLLANGINLKGVTRSSTPIAQIRKATSC